jgi:hypothetical protein
MRGSALNDTDVGSNFLNFSLGLWNFLAKQSFLPAAPALILYHSDDIAYFLSSSPYFFSLLQENDKMTFQIIRTNVARRITSAVETACLNDYLAAMMVMMVVVVVLNMVRYSISVLVDQHRLYYYYYY